MQAHKDIGQWLVNRQGKKERKKAKEAGFMGMDMDMDMDDMEWRGASPLPLFSLGFSFSRERTRYSHPPGRPLVQLLLDVCVFVFIRWAASNSMVFLSVGFFNACLDNNWATTLTLLSLFFSHFSFLPIIAQSTLLYSTRLDSNTPFSHSYSHSLTLTLHPH